MALFLSSNFSNTTLAAPITSGQTTITLAAGTGALFPSPTGGKYFSLVLNDALTGLVYEVCYCTARSTDTLTVSRGQEGTTARAWLLGDFAYRALTAGNEENVIQIGTAAGGSLSGTYPNPSLAAQGPGAVTTNYPESITTSADGRITAITGYGYPAVLNLGGGGTIYLGWNGSYVTMQVGSTSEGGIISTQGGTITGGLNVNGTLVASGVTLSGGEVTAPSGGNFGASTIYFGNGSSTGSLGIVNVLASNVVNATAGGTIGGVGLSGSGVTAGGGANLGGGTLTVGNVNSSGTVNGAAVTVGGNPVVINNTPAYGNIILGYDGSVAMTVGTTYEGQIVTNSATWWAFAAGVAGYAFFHATGMIMQWDQINSANGIAVGFVTTFPNDCLTMVCVESAANGTFGAGTPTIHGTSGQGPSNWGHWTLLWNGSAWVNNGDTCMYIAIGY
jgi:hypothetical protein